MSLPFVKARTKPAWIIAWLLVFPSLVGIPLPALALKCGGTEATIADLYKQATYVFIGTPYNIDLPIEPNPVRASDLTRGASFVLSGPKAAEIRDQLYGHAQADFIVFKLYKGDLAKMPRVRFSRVMGDLDPQLGMGYLILADAHGNTGICYGSNQSVQYLVRDGEEIKKWEAALKAEQLPGSTDP